MHTSSQLKRSHNDRMIAGVAGGIGRYLNIDPVIVRLAFVLLAFSGASLLLYPLLWVIMPEEPLGTASQKQPFVAEGTTTQRIRIDPDTGLPEHEIPIHNAGVSASTVGDPSNRQQLLGIILLGIGAFIAMKILIPGIIPLMVPALMIAGGIWLLRHR